MYIYIYYIRTTTQVEAALAPLRDEEGYLKPIFPKQWRFKVRQ